MKRIPFKSLYTRLVVTFISIWWMVSFVSFGLIMRFFANPDFVNLHDRSAEFVEQFQTTRQWTFLTLLISIVLGTLAILYFSQGIVKPINQLSKASLEIEKGHFDASVKIEGKDELAQLGNNFNNMARALSKLDQSRKDFVSSVSHEFKTPVTSIKGFAQMILQAKEMNQIKDYAQIILEESETLNQLSSELLNLSQIDSDVILPEQSLVSVDEVLRKVVLTLEPLSQNKQIEVQLNLEETKLLANEFVLTQIFTNLLSNAIKYSNQRTSIQIELKKEGQSAIFSIKDQGVGIAEQHIEHIFDRFYKADNARSGEGHGLGLAIVKARLDQMKAKIEVQSQVGQGTRFTIYF